MSADKRYLLLVHDIRYHSEHSYSARYQVYDTANSFVQPLTVDDNEQGDELFYAAWGYENTTELPISLST